MNADEHRPGTNRQDAKNAKGERGPKSDSLTLSIPSSLIPFLRVWGLGLRFLLFVSER